MQSKNERSRDKFTTISGYLNISHMAVVVSFLVLVSSVLMFMMMSDSEESNAAPNQCGDDLTWEFDLATNTLTISGTGKMDDFNPLSIPWAGNNIKNVIMPEGMTHLGNYAFLNCTTLTSIVIPNSVTSIGDNVFHGCFNLTSIAIQNNVTSIGNEAFAMCRGLTSVEIPDSVTEIGSNIFSGCPNLTSISLSNRLTSIPEDAFKGCSALTSVEIPNSVTSIGPFAFSTCRNLTSVVIPDSVTSIGNNAFEYCMSMTSVIIPKSITSISDKAFFDCNALISVKIPDSVTSIGEESFSGCSSMVYFEIPDSVSSIGNNAFNNYRDLKYLILTGTESSPNKVMSNGVLNQNKLPGMGGAIENIVIDGYVDLSGLLPNGTPKLIFNVDKSHIKNSTIFDVDDLKGSVYKYVSSNWVKDALVAYTVTFEANGDSCIPYVVTDGPTTLPIPVKRGYDFEGWHLDDEFLDAAVSSSYTPLSDTTLYANYFEKTYTISYNKNGGSGPAVTPVTISYEDLFDEGYELKSSDTFTAPAGKEFMGWIIGVSPLYEEHDIINDKNINGNVVVYAAWSPGVNVTFDANGGSVDPTDKTVAYGGKYGDIPTPAKGGYLFDGWYLNGREITSTSIVSISVDHTLVASWSLPLTLKYVEVTFNANGGLVYPESKTVSYGHEYGSLPMPVNDGYAFDGWYFNGKLITGSSIVDTRYDHTLTAKWSDPSISADISSDDSSRYYTPLIIVFAASALMFMMLLVLAYIRRRKDEDE